MRSEVTDAIGYCEGFYDPDVNPDWLGKPANIKVENNGGVVYFGSSLTVHNLLLFLSFTNCD